MGLPLNRKLILFGSVKTTDKRKGIDYFIDSCHILAQKHPHLTNEWEIVVYGNGSGELTKYLPFNVHPLNYISSTSELIDIYNAVDIFATPSLEENLPNTIMEAMACATPCIGFETGGIPEMIDHKENGYVAEYKSAEDFANGIYWILNESNFEQLSENARNKVVNSYSEKTVAAEYLNLYKEIIR